MPLFYIVAGDQSGDVLGARLMRAIVARCPDARFAGIGGNGMAALGQDCLFAMRELALMGLLEGLPKVCQLKACIRQSVADIEAKRPDVEIGRAHV